MKTQLKATLAAAITAALLGSSAAYAGASANVGVTSNYIWRGVTQSGDEAAVSGGLDYDFGNGFSVGTWASSLGGGNAYELDLYGGYGGEIGAFDYSVGVINYMYPLADPGTDFAELNGSIGYGPVTFGANYTFNADDNTLEGDMYYSLDASTEIKPGLSLGGVVGYYDPDAAGADDYTHYQASLSKGDFTFAVDKTDQSGTAGDPRVSVSWTHALDL